METVKVLRVDGSLAMPHELGRIVVSLPLPPGNMSTLFKNSELFKKTYFQRYPVNGTHTYCNNIQK